MDSMSEVVVGSSMAARRDVRAARAPSRRASSAARKRRVAIDPNRRRAEPCKYFARLAFERVAADVIVFLLDSPNLARSVPSRAARSGSAHRVLRFLRS